MPYLNTTTVMGNLVAAPEQRSTPAGSVATFRMAIHSGGFDGKPERADFIDCEAWNGWAETLCRTASKGALVLVMGRIVQDRWQDAATGQPRSRVKVVASRAFHLQRPRREDGGATGLSLAEDPGQGAAAGDGARAEEDAEAAG